jgi:chromosome segregation ATPase
MAEMRHFLEELDRHLELLRSSIDHIGAQLEENATRLRTLREHREQRITDYLYELLPDTAPESIAALNRRMPGVLTVEQVRRALDDTRRTYQTQFDQLTREYDDSRYNALELQFEHQLGEERESLNNLKDSLDSLHRKTSIARLVKSRYGRPDYPYRWYHGEYYRDWREADEAVEKTKTRDWNELAERYTAQVSAVETLQESVTSLDTKLTLLRRKRAQYQELSDALPRIPEIVLERLRTKLRGHIEGLSSMPPGLSDLPANSTEITRLLEEGNRLQESRGELMKQLTNLQMVRGQASGSTRRHVPDNYLDDLRSYPPPNPSAHWSGPASVHVHQHSSNGGFLTGLWFGEMMSFFSDQASYERGRRDERSFRNHQNSYRSDTWRAARNDYSGQS